MYKTLANHFNVADPLIGLEVGDRVVYKNARYGRLYGVITKTDGERNYVIKPDRFPDLEEHSNGYNLKKVGGTR